MLPCPACQQHLSGSEPSCPRCGHPLQPPAAPPSSAPASDAQEPGAPPEQWAEVPAYTAHPPVGAASNRRQFSSVQPVWQYGLLQLCSFGLYDLIWFYANWKLIQERNGWSVTPAARALFRIFWIRSYCREVFKLAEPFGFKSEFIPVTLATAYIVFGMLGRAADRASGATALALSIVFFMGQILAMVPVVQAANVFWRHEQPDLPVRTMLSPGAVVTIIIGGILWLALIADAVAPAG